jgi:hypothetical protein
MESELGRQKEQMVDQLLEDGKIMSVLNDSEGKVINFITR